MRGNTYADLHCCAPRRVSDCVGRGFLTQLGERRKNQVSIGGFRASTTGGRSIDTSQIVSLRLTSGLGSDCAGIGACRALAAHWRSRIRRAWIRTISEGGGERSMLRHHFALVALGGFGRGELQPYSDLEVLILCDAESLQKDSARAEASRLITGAFSRFWDSCVHVAVAVRTVDECIQQARADPKFFTALLDGRFLTGASALHRRLYTRFWAECVCGHEWEYIRTRVADRMLRYRMDESRFGCGSEPNIKDGRGGLRDIHNVMWAAQVLFGVRSWNVLCRAGVLREAELRRLVWAFDFLLQVRTAIHQVAGQALDKLVPEVQDPVAREFGYRASRGLAPAVRLLKELSRLMDSVARVTCRVETSLLDLAEARR